MRTGAIIQAVSFQILKVNAVGNRAVFYWNVSYIFTASDFVSAVPEQFLCGANGSAGVVSHQDAGSSVCRLAGAIRQKSL